MLHQTTRTSLIQHFAPTWGAAAWKSYLIQGRGVLSVRVRQQHEDSIDVTIDYLSARNCRSEDIRQLAASYDPTVEYVLLLGIDDDDTEGAVIRMEQPLANLVAEPRSSHQSGKPRIRRRLGTLLPL